jgi:hypothetical protein
MASELATTGCEVVGRWMQVFRAAGKMTAGGAVEQVRQDVVCEEEDVAGRVESGRQQRSMNPVDATCARSGGRRPVGRRSSAGRLVRIGARGGREASLTGDDGCGLYDSRHTWADSAFSLPQFWMKDE